MNMLTKEQALDLVLQELKRMSPKDNPFVIIDKHTIEKPFGWVFFFNSKKFLDTGINRFRLFGNGPIIVNKFSGTLELFGSGKPPDDIVMEYERKLTPDHK